MCLMRAVFKNEKISTVVHAKDVNKFQLAYCNLLKSNMDGLKRQKKQKSQTGVPLKTASPLGKLPSKWRQMRI